jgi:hypothetical protein
MFPKHGTDKTHLSNTQSNAVWGRFGGWRCSKGTLNNTTTARRLVYVECKRTVLKFLMTVAVAFEKTLNLHLIVRSIGSCGCGLQEERDVALHGPCGKHPQETERGENGAGILQAETSVRRRLLCTTATRRQSKAGAAASTMFQLPSKKGTPTQAASIGFGGTHLKSIAACAPRSHLLSLS